MLPKINLEHLELLRPWRPQIQLHGGRGLHETNFNTQCYNDAIGLTDQFRYLHTSNSAGQRRWAALGSCPALGSAAQRYLRYVDSGTDPA